MKLTPQQLAALKQFQAWHGRGWRAKLLTAWSAGLSPGDTDMAAALRQLRNQLGPIWLAKYQVGHEGVGWLARRRMEVGSGERGYRWVDAWAIVHQDGTDMIQPYMRRKGEARAVARDLNITLMEEPI